MARTDLNDIVAQLGVSQSALSQTIRGLEARLGLRLLTPTTRSVAPTDASERLLRSAGPRLDEIDADLSALSALREKLAGASRITAHDHAVRAFLWPALAKLLPDYPDIKVEVVIEYGLTDIVAGRFDAGIRTGEMVAKDMVTVRIGADLRFAVVGAPAYFRTRAKPKTPQELTSHDCINLRLPTLAACMRGSSRRAGGRCASGSRASSPSTERPRCSMGHWRGLAWPTAPSQPGWRIGPDPQALAGGGGGHADLRCRAHARHRRHCPAGLDMPCRPAGTLAHPGRYAAPDSARDRPLVRQTALRATCGSKTRAAPTAGFRHQTWSGKATERRSIALARHVLTPTPHWWDGSGLQTGRLLPCPCDVFRVAAAILVEALWRQLRHPVGKCGEEMPVARDEQHGALVLRHSRATKGAEYEEMIPHGRSTAAADAGHACP